MRLYLLPVLILIVGTLGFVGYWDQSSAPRQSRECLVHVVVDAYTRQHEGVGVDIQPWHVDCRDLPQPTVANRPRELARVRGRSRSPRPGPSLRRWLIEHHDLLPSGR